MTIRRTALVVLVPEAEAMVAPLRMRHDRMAALGVPAHVTVLHPFTPLVDAAIAAQIAEVCASIEPFDAEFASVGRFPGGVVWLRPEPRERFLAAMLAVQQTFPEWPPYGGAYHEAEPHLTVASGVDEASADEVDRVLLTQLTDRPPIASPVRGLTLLEEAMDLGWTVSRTWPLGTRTSAVRSG